MAPTCLLNAQHGDKLSTLARIAINQIFKSVLQLATMGHTHNSPALVIINLFSPFSSLLLWTPANIFWC